ncbi:MAG: CRISPR-associated ring nuclease Csm6 [Syntrophobacteraceae bacterium]
MSPNPSDLRNVLVAVSGQTPAIITETLWALERQFATRVDEIRIITTSRGRDIISNRLLGANGEFSRFCADYEIPPGRIAFSEKSVYVLNDSRGSSLEDIRTREDNANAADQVYNLINEWCKRKDESLLCSVAGGRKTLGIYLAMSLMMCGRKDDKLYHVLVSPSFETGVPAFFYPPPRERLYSRSNPLGTAHVPDQISSKEARVELAEVPFIRLRDVTERRNLVPKGYLEAVKATQLVMHYLQSPPELRISLETCAVKIGRFEFTLSKQRAAVYSFFLLHFNGIGAGASIETLFDNRMILADLERRIDKFGIGEKEVYSWQKLRDLEEFKRQMGPCITKVNKDIRRNLANDLLASRYLISLGGSYGVNVKRFKVLGANSQAWKGLQ